MVHRGVFGSTASNDMILLPKKDWLRRHSGTLYPSQAFVASFLPAVCGRLPTITDQGGGVIHSEDASKVTFDHTLRRTLLFSQP